MEGLAGVTAIETSVGAVTVNTVEPEIDPEVALIELVPTPAPVARPPAAIVAVEVVAEAHVTEAVRFCVLLSLNVPVAVNCCLFPRVIEGFAGVTEMEVRDGTTGSPTARFTEPVTGPAPAVMVAVPLVEPKTVPPLPVSLLTVAT